MRRLLQPVSKQGLPQVQHGADGQAAGEFRTQACLLARAGPHLDDGFGMLEQLPAFRGELDVIAAAREQRHANGLFQLPNAGADRGLCDTQLDGGLAEVAGTRDFQKRAQQFDVHIVLSINDIDRDGNKFLFAARVHASYKPLLMIILNRTCTRSLPHRAPGGGCHGVIMAGALYNPEVFRFPGETPDET